MLTKKIMQSCALKVKLESVLVKCGAHAASRTLHVEQGFFVQLLAFAFSDIIIASSQ